MKSLLLSLKVPHCSHQPHVYDFLNLLVCKYFNAFGRERYDNVCGFSLLIFLHRRSCFHNHHRNENVFRVSFLRCSSQLMHIWWSYNLRKTSFRKNILRLFKHYTIHDINRGNFSTCFSYTYTNITTTAAMLHCV